MRRLPEVLRAALPALAVLAAVAVLLPTDLIPIRSALLQGAIGSYGCSGQPSVGIGSAIQSSGISSPADHTVVVPGATVTLVAANATDTDYDYDACGNPTAFADTCTYEWQANGYGSFPQGRNQQTVTWIAPTTPGNYTISLVVDDAHTSTQAADDPALPAFTIAITVQGPDLYLNLDYDDANFLPIPDDGLPVATGPGLSGGSPTVTVRGWVTDKNGNNPPLAVQQQLIGKTIQMTLTSSAFPGRDSAELAAESTAQDFSLHKNQILSQLNLVLKQVTAASGELWLFIGEPDGQDLNGDGVAGDGGLKLWAKDMRALGAVTGTLLGGPAGYTLTSMPRQPLLDFNAPLDFTGPQGALVIPTPCPGANVANVAISKEVPRAWWNQQVQDAASIGINNAPSRPSPTADLEPRDPDGAGAIPPHLTGGDGYSVWQEYGGYPWTNAQDADARRRLRPYRKEMLLSVSIMLNGRGSTNSATTVAKARAAIGAAVTAFGDAGVEIYWTWNYVRGVTGHNRSVKGKMLQQGTAWVPYDPISSVTILRNYVSTYRFPGTRSMVFAWDGGLGELAKDYGYSDFDVRTGTTSVQGAVIFEFKILRDFPNDDAMLRALAVPHELAHLTHMEHLEKVAFPIKPWHRALRIPVSAVQPTAVYSNHLMWGGFRPNDQPGNAWPILPPPGLAIFKASDRTPVFFAGDDFWPAGEVGLFDLRWPSAG